MEEVEKEGEEVDELGEAKGANKFEESAIAVAKEGKGERKSRMDDIMMEDIERIHYRQEGVVYYRGGV
jgi:hypothetical protein